MRRLAIGIAAVALLAVVAWRLLGGVPGVVGAALPDLPDLPAPAERLGAEAAGTVYFASSTRFGLDVLLAGNAHALSTTGVGTLLLPEGASAEAPAPAMVVLHGSGGIMPGREREQGRLLADHGIAAFVLDYYAPRGVTQETPYMLRVLSVTEFDAIADAYGAFRILRTHPAIDPERIGVMGFSYGGMAARFAMDERVRRVLDPDGPGFAAFADFYGPCFQDLGTHETNGAPLLTLRGSEDASNELAACREREDALRALGAAVEAHVYEGAGHAWEAARERALSPRSPYVAGCTVRYDEAGHSSVDGQPVVDVPLETSREERIALRLSSGDVMADCVRSGYVIGRDDATRARADADLLAFLARALGP